MTSSRSCFASTGRVVLKPGESLASGHLRPANNSYAYIPGLASTFPPGEDDAHGQDEDLSFTTADEKDVAAGDGQSVRITPKKSSNIDDIAKRERATKTKQNPCFTPEGLRPRKSIEEIRAVLSLNLGNINPDKCGNICSSKLETAKKTNVSFSSHHSSLGSICSSLDDKFDVFKRRVAVRCAAADDSKKKSRKIKETTIGGERTLVGLLAAQNEVREGEFISDGTAYSHRKPPGSKTGDDEALEFRSRPILPPYHDDFQGESPYSSDDDDDSDTTEQSNSQHWYNEWCQYETYRDGQEGAEEDSFSSYNSRHALVETNEHQSDRSHHVGNEKSDNIYDFSPLEDLGDDKIRSAHNGNDPFVVRGHDSSWISDISQNTSSQKGNETFSQRAKHELSFTQSTLEQRRLRKESLITELVHRLKDNKSLIRDIETLDVGRRRHEKYDLDEEGILYDYSWKTRSLILSTLHRIIVTYDPAGESQDVEMFHAIYFFGTLVNLTASTCEKAAGHWRPKTWLHSEITSMLYDPFQDSNGCEDSFNNLSAGDSSFSLITISPMQKSEKCKVPLSRTITNSLAILRDVSKSLKELIKNDSASQEGALDALVRSYIDLLNISSDNISLLNCAFEFLPRRERAIDASRDLSTSLMKKWDNLEAVAVTEHTRQRLFEARDFHREDDDDLTISTMESGPSILKAHKMNAVKNSG